MHKQKYIVYHVFSKKLKILIGKSNLKKLEMKRLNLKSSLLELLLEILHVICNYLSFILLVSNDKI